jgi:hypothetical protein
LELIFDVVKTREFNGGDDTEIVPMVIPVLVVITHYASVIASVQCMVDVRKVVTSHLPLYINPDLPSKLPIPTLLRDVVDVINNFLISHDIFYHACISSAIFVTHSNSPNSPSLHFRTAIKASMTLISQVLLYKLVSRCKPLLY